MLRKLLLSLFAIFAFSEMQAQLPSALSATVTDCGPGAVTFDPVFDDAPTNTVPTLTNDKYTYLRSSGPDTSVGIVYDGTQWVFYHSSNPANILFFQDTHNPADNLTDETHLFPPDTGWQRNPAGLCTNVLSTFVLTSGAVLDVEKEQLDKMSLYPNPASGFVRISNLQENTRVTVTNITGQTVRNEVLDRNNNSIDVQDLAKGFYFVEIEGKKTIKLIKN